MYLHFLTPLLLSDLNIASYYFRCTIFAINQAQEVFLKLNSFSFHRIAHAHHRRM